MAKVNKVTIVHTNPNFSKRKINLPDIGEVTTNKLGEVEVPEEIAELLVNNSPSWKLKEEPVEDTEDDEDEEGEEEDDEDDANSGDETDDEDNEEEEDDEEDSEGEEFTAEDGVNVLAERYTMPKLKLAAKNKMKITEKDIKSCVTKQDLLNFIQDNWDDIPVEFKEELAAL